MTVAGAVDVAELLEDLVRIPSPTGHVTAAVRWLAARSEALGFRSHVDAAGNVVMGWGAGAAEDEILLLGHLDTVPGALPVRVSAGRLHGRGTVDAKGPLAAALAAVTRLPRDGAPVAVVAAVDEEGPSLGAQHLRDSRPAPAHLLILEPSGWDTVTTAYRGCVRLEVASLCPRAHRAGPQRGAADLLVERLARLQRVAGGEERGRAVDSLQLRIGTLTTATTTAVERAAATLELRLPQGTTVDGALDLLGHDLDGLEWRVVSACEPVAVPRTGDAARALARAITATGARPRWTTKTGTSDLNVVWPAWRCDAAVYGPGECRLDHTPHESIALDELRRGVDVLERAVAALR